MMLVQNIERNQQGIIAQSLLESSTQLLDDCKIQFTSSLHLDVPGCSNHLPLWQ